MAKTQKKLASLNSKDQVSKWSEDADFRLENWKWLNYSSQIARRVYVAVKEREGMNQKVLAEKLGVTPQHISKILKGEENLTLETIAKLSEALDIELINFPDYKYSKQVVLKEYISKNNLAWTGLLKKYVTNMHTNDYHQLLPDTHLSLAADNAQTFVAFEKK